MHAVGSPRGCRRDRLCSTERVADVGRGSAPEGLACHGLRSHHRREQGAHRLHVTRLSCMPAGRHVIHSCIRQPALGGVSCTLAVTDLTWKICTWHLHRPATVCTWHQPGWSRNMLGAMPTGPSGFADLTCDSPSWLNPAHGQCLCACTLFDSPRPAVYSASGGPRWDSRAGQEPGSPSVEVRGSEAGALSFCPRDLGLWRGTGPGLLCPRNP